jgi:hypothetical protein
VLSFVEVISQQTDVPARDDRINKMEEMSCHIKLDEPDNNELTCVSRQRHVCHLAKPQLARAVKREGS